VPEEGDIIMKPFTATALISLAGILGAGTALAQDRGVRATMPFDFEVGGQLLPAGTYTITPISDNRIEIRNRDKHVAMQALALADSNRSKRGGVLVFDRYSNQYFLHEILCESAAMNLNLPTSKEEKKARVAGEVQASIPSNSGEVLIAAN
jgi:hypothetical protein